MAMVIEFQSNNVSCSDCLKWDGERCTKRGWTNEDPDHPCMMIEHYRATQQPDDDVFGEYMQPSAKMRDEALKLKREGLTYVTMARVSGVGYSTLKKVAGESLDRVTASTMKKWTDALPYMERMAGI